jgi:hypothetical protein
LIRGDTVVAAVAALSAMAVNRNLRHPAIILPLNGRPTVFWQLVLNPHVFGSASDSVSNIGSLRCMLEMGDRGH